jgi:hypothetical protein
MVDAPAYASLGDQPTNAGRLVSQAKPDRRHEVSGQT